MYDDPYNNSIANEVLKDAKRNALHIDQLNGSGKGYGAFSKGQLRQIILDKNKVIADLETKAYGKGKCSGGMRSDDGARTKHPAQYWFNQENEVFEDDISRPDVAPASVRNGARMKENLGAGRPMRGGSGMVGFPERAPYSAVEPQSVLYQRAAVDLGAGKYTPESEPKDEDDLRQKMEGLRQKFIGKGMSRSQVTSECRKMLKRGHKGRAVMISKMICAKRGGTLPLQSGCGMSGSNMGMGMGMSAADRQVGSMECCSKCGHGQGRCSGGYAPVAIMGPEALAGYDNSRQPRAMIPPPSVNEQPGMCGGAKKKVQYQQQYVSPSEMGQQLLPVSQLPSGIGGGNIAYANNSGSIIPNLQSRVAIGSGGDGRSKRGALVSKLMREKGMSLAEASKYIKANKLA